MSEDDSSLIRHSLFTSFLLIVLHTVFLLIPYIVVGSQLFFPAGAEPLVFFLLEFGSLALLWFLIVPFGLHLPDGQMSHREFLDAIRLSRIQPLFRNFVSGIGFGSVFLMGLLIAALFTGTFVVDLGEILPPNSWSLLTALTPAIWEEVAFRGVILVLLLKTYNKRFAISLSALLFAVPHLLNLLGTTLSTDTLFTAVAQVFWAFFGGFFLAYLVIKTDSLLPSIIIHYLIVAVGPLLIHTPGASPIIKGILMILGLGIIPSIINTLLLRFMSEMVNSRIHLSNSISANSARKRYGVVWHLFQPFDNQVDDLALAQRLHDFQVIIPYALSMEWENG